MRSSHVILAAAALCLAAPLAAQTCLGGPSFADGRFAGIGSITSGNDATAYRATLNYGKPMGTFFGGSFSAVDYDGTDASSTSVAISIGHELQQTRPNVSICPMGSLARGFGPDIGLAETSSVMLSGGASVGASLSLGTEVTGIPFLGASFVHLRTTTETAGVEGSDTDSFLSFTAGFGLVISRTFGITPSVQLPVGLGDADPTFTLAMQYNFGRR